MTNPWKVARRSMRANAPSVLGLAQAAVWTILVGSAFARVGALPLPLGDEEPPEPEVAAVADTAAPCALGQSCRPIVVDTPAFVHVGDTRQAGDATVLRYGCAPERAEAGPEVWYQVDVQHPGVLRARIEEDPADGVDVDVHLLSAVDPERCVARGDAEVAAQVEPGTWYVVVDTCSIEWSKPGPYRLTIDTPDVDRRR